MDRLLAMLLLLPATPVIGALVLLVRATSQGPGIFRQVRVGKHGKPFTMYKLRTMCVDAEVESGATWSTGKADPRMTPVGRFLRRCHLDELPQLWNVVRGDMSLVGPRPERPEFVRGLAEAIPGYADRQAVLPGITGLAQINLPPDTDLMSVQRKQILDLEYIEQGGLWLDVRMIACSFLRLFGVRGDLAMNLLRLHRTVVLDDLPEAVSAGTVSLADASVNGSPRAMTAREVEEAARGRQSCQDTVTIQLAETQTDLPVTVAATLVPRDNVLVPGNGHGSCKGRPKKVVADLGARAVCVTARPKAEAQLALPIFDPPDDGPGSEFDPSFVGRWIHRPAKPR